MRLPQLHIRNFFILVRKYLDIEIVSHLFPDPIVPLIWSCRVSILSYTVDDNPSWCQPRSFHGPSDGYLNNHFQRCHRKHIYTKNVNIFRKYMKYICIVVIEKFQSYVCLYDLSLDYQEVSMLKSILVNKNFQNLASDWLAPQVPKFVLTHVVKYQPYEFRTSTTRTNFHQAQEPYNIFITNV